MKKNYCLNLVFINLLYVFVKLIYIMCFVKVMKCSSYSKLL